MPKAVRFDEFGPIENLYIGEIPMPQVSDDGVVVQVKTAGVNPGEHYIRQGMLGGEVPSGQGWDFAGIISEVGAEVTAFKTGDEVIGHTDRASQAEFVAVPQSNVVKKPVAMSWEVAGGFFVVATTAYAAVQAVGAGDGDTVGVSGASGGVGMLVVQLLREKGCNVIAIASEANHEWLQSHGAIPVVYGDGLIDRIKQLAPAGLDAFIDLYGEEYLHLALELGVAKNRIDTIIAFEAAGKLGVKAEGSSAAATPEIMSEMAEKIADGTLEFIIAKTYPMDRVQEAYKDVSSGHTHGKIVLTVSE